MSRWLFAVPVAVAVAVAVAGCTGEAPPSGARDAAVSTGDGGGPADARMIQWVDAAPGTTNDIPCVNPVLPAPNNGNHFPGQSCFQNCHNHGFTVAGTLYTNATGNSAFAGATITVYDANNVREDMVVNTNGNFYTRRALAFPLLTFASSCPSATRMEASSPNGNCNANGCHQGGTSSQIHLP